MRMKEEENMLNNQLKHGYNVKISNSKANIHCKLQFLNPNPRGYPTRVVPPKKCTGFIKYSLDTKLRTVMLDHINTVYHKSKESKIIGGK